MAVSDGGGAAKEDLIEVDLGDTVRAIDNMRLVVHEAAAHALSQQQQQPTSMNDFRASVSSKGSASAAAAGGEYQVR